MLAEETQMNFLIIFLILTSHSFSKTQTDSSKIDLPEIEIYGGIEENSISTNIDVFFIFKIPI